jgi:hypothetical protein
MVLLLPLLVAVFAAATTTAAACGARLALVTLYYDWKLKANLNIISSQLGSQGTVWDLEWNNGTSFIFSRDQPVCKTLHFDVGILTPDWLKDSKYLGRTAADNFVTNVWTKAKFINYYADQVSRGAGQ